MDPYLSDLAYIAVCKKERSGGTTLDSGINVGVRLLVLGLFSSGYVLIKGGTLIDFFYFLFS